MCGLLRGVETVKCTDLIMPVSLVPARVAVLVAPASSTTPPLRCSPTAPAAPPQLRRSSARARTAVIAAATDGWSREKLRTRAPAASPTPPVNDVDALLLAKGVPPRVRSALLIRARVTAVASPPARCSRFRAYSQVRTAAAGSAFASASTLATALTTLQTILAIQDDELVELLREDRGPELAVRPAAAAAQQNGSPSHRVLT